ncbi:MAG: HAMP domain-containing sensor histidine kinase [Myxococcales bacterium]
MPSIHPLAALGEIAAEIAHELRNVLQVARTSVYLIRRDLARGAPVEDSLARLDRSVANAQAVVDDVLALAQAQALAKESVRLVETLRAACEDFDVHLDDIGIAPDLEVRAARGLLVRLFRSLLDNAVQTAPAGPPKITARAWHEDGKVVVEVADNGPGIAASLAPRIFEPLMTGRPGGTGLGLALAARIARAHGGSLTLVDGPGGESTNVPAVFRLALPV